MNPPTATTTLLLALWSFLTVLTAQAAGAESAGDYFPPPESRGGWRKLDQPDDIRRLAGTDPDKLAELKQWLLNSDKRNFAAVVLIASALAVTNMVVRPQLNEWQAERELGFIPRAAAIREIYPDTYQE